jgi:uncharacterized membrane protein
MKIKTLLYSLGLGAGVMYFYDPREGNRRRSMVRDQFNRVVNQANGAIDTGVVDLRNRTRGILAEMMGRLDNQQAPDWIVEERIRSRLGRLSRRAGGLEIRSQNGNIVLNGPILREDATNLIQAISRTRGVRSVENHLQVIDNPQDFPALQAMRGSMGQDGNGTTAWSPATRLVAGVGGGVLALYGMARKGIVGPALSLTGLYLAARSVTNQQLGAMLGIGGTEGSQNAIRVNKAININAPIDQVYRFWSNFENFPLFMNHVKEITVQGDGRSHWMVAGPAGSTVEFDAITTRDIPNESIAWQTTPESQVHHDGFVRFDENGDGTTRVSVHMNYVPPAGVVGHAVAKLFGVDPRQAMHDDLVRLKSLLETGKTSTDETKVRVKNRSGSA